jgi:hypothetical protein
LPLLIWAIGQENFEPPAGDEKVTEYPLAGGRVV